MSDGGDGASDFNDDLQDRTGGRYDPDIVVTDGRRLSELFEDAIDLEAIGIPENTFGDVVFSLVAAANAKGQNARAHTQLWICSSVTLYIACLFGQFLLSFALFATTIAHEEGVFDDANVGNMTTVLQAAIQAHEKVEDERVNHLCARSDITIVPAYVAMLAVWFLRMLDEIFSLVWITMVTQRVPLETPVAPVEERAVHNRKVSFEDFSGDYSGDEDDDSVISRRSSRRPSLTRRLSVEFSVYGEKFHQIRLMTLRIRSLCLLIAIPRLVMTLWIMWVGAKFLIFSHKCKDLILKALVCSFFVQVEHLVFHSLISDTKKRTLKQTTLFFRPLKSEDWSYYGSTATRLALTALLIGIVWFGLYGHIRAFRYACRAYEQIFPRSDGVMANGLAWLVF